MLIAVGEIVDGLAYARQVFIAAGACQTGIMAKPRYCLQQPHIMYCAYNKKVWDEFAITVVPNETNECVGGGQFLYLCL